MSKNNLKDLINSQSLEKVILDYSDTLSNMNLKIYKIWLLIL